MREVDRRTFLSGAAAGAALSSIRSAVAASESSKPISIALIGANGRGSDLAGQFLTQPDVRFTYVCDPDDRALAKGVAAVTGAGGDEPRGVKDFRRALDDPAVDAVIVATPNHWHAAATIIALAAGKHVYVEKPCSHTGEEGEAMIRAADNAGKVVQVGMQRRSGTLYRQMVERARGGAIGEPLFARSWYFNNRPSIGHGMPAEPPAELDFERWQGPAPEEPYRDNILHYNWHFFWHWGNAELGNNGVHLIDVCRWALGVDFPSRVTCSGKRMRFDDDQQTPDVTSAWFDCGEKAIQWEAVCWTTPLNPDDAIGIEIRGTKGSLEINDARCVIYDLDRKVTEELAGTRGDAEHIRNFLDAIGGEGKPAASIEDGHRSALFCHLGNIALRSGASLEVDSATGHPTEDAIATKYWGREYRPGWGLDELG
jgi:predicted dehydrogenase